MLRIKKACVWIIMLLEWRTPYFASKASKTWKSCKKCRCRKRFKTR